jgi:threonine-phosphate decarboxylase
MKAQCAIKDDFQMKLPAASGWGIQNILINLQKQDFSYDFNRKVFMLGGHGGNIYEMARRLGCTPSEFIDMSSNINPLGPPPGLVNYLEKNIDAITNLPEVDSKEIEKKFAEHFDLDPDRVLAGNGTTQFIYMTPQVLETKGALVLGPTYADYADACRLHNVHPAIVMAEESDNFRPNISRLVESIDGENTVFICNPNNPTGSLIPKNELEWFCRSHPDTNFIVDESYLPFVNLGEKESMINSQITNVIVLISISKIFKIPGLRIGFAISCAETIKKFRRYMLPWSMNSLAQAAGRYLASQVTEVSAFIKKTKIFFENQRKEFYEKIEHSPGIKLFPATTPFVLIKLPGFLSAGNVCGQLARDKILVRNCTNFHGLSDQFIRISLKTRPENRMLAEKLLSLLKSSRTQSQNFS